MSGAAILFSRPMMRAILACHKTVTRRICKPIQEADLPYDEHGNLQFTNPYGQAGNRLWVKEAWRTIAELDDKTPSQIADTSLDIGYCKPWAPIQYEADGQRKHWESMLGNPGEPSVGRYRHARFMPRWASRITLQVIAVRVERLHEISAADCLAEGITPQHANNKAEELALLHIAYASLWETLHGRGSWNANPWVWVIKFERIK